MFIVLLNAIHSPRPSGNSAGSSKQYVGRLRLCSSSLLLEPESPELPMVRFALKSVSALAIDSSGMISFRSSSHTILRNVGEYVQAPPPFPHYFFVTSCACTPQRYPSRDKTPTPCPPSSARTNHSPLSFKRWLLQPSTAPLLSLLPTRNLSLPTKL